MTSPGCGCTRTTRISPAFRPNAFAEWRGLSMSSSIWIQCAGDSSKQRLGVSAWRVIEAQHHVSTRKLVDSAEEQELLEELIESSKPPAVAGVRLHYLPSTPFRYP